MYRANKEKVWRNHARIHSLTQTAPPTLQVYKLNYDMPNSES